MFQKEDGKLLHLLKAGAQLMGDTALIHTADVNFKILVDSHGDYERNTDLLSTGIESEIGGYDVNADCDEVTITPKGFSDGDVYSFHFMVIS